jgi:hypothetical protein
MDRLPLKREEFFLDENNPDHTGWRYPGLQHAIKSPFTAEINDPQGMKRVFYTMQKLHFFPCRHLRKLGREKSPSVIRPAQLHREEGPGGNIFAFVSWITFVKHKKREWWRMINHLHVYTAGSDLEIPRDATLADILSGKYGEMDQEHPLRVIWIPGNKGDFDQNFPSLSWVCGGRKRGVMHMLSFETPCAGANGKDDSLPTYEELPNERETKIKDE